MRVKSKYASKVGSSARFYSLNYKNAEIESGMLFFSVKAKKRLGESAYSLFIIKLV